MIIVYAAASFVILELVSIIEEPFALPDWTLRLVFVILCIGLFLSIILSWIYDITPEGIEKTKPAREAEEETIEKPSQPQAWKIATIISVVVIIGLILFHAVGERKQDEDIAILDKSIAVLPFKSLSDDPEKQYLADGAMDAILLHLSKIKDLRVMARTSVEQYRKTDKTATMICQELNVAYLLEGSFQKYGDKARLIVQLIKPGMEGHIWADEYDRDWTDIFFVQSEVAKSVANEIRAVVTPEVKLRIEKEPTGNMEAYNLYLQGRHHFLSRGGKEGLDRSIQLYDQALETDPDFALAYSAIAASYSAYAYGEILPRSEVMDLAKEAARKALSIDNTLGEAHAELAWARIYHDFNWIEGERGLQLALELNPNYATAHRNYSWLLTFIGRHEESIAEAKRAVELDPISQAFWGWLTRVYLYARDYDQAIAESQKFLRKYPDSQYLRRWLSLAYLCSGMNQEALNEISRVKYPTWVDGYIYGIAGKTEKAKEVLYHHLERSKTQFVKPTDLTVMYTGLGEYDKALDYLEQAYDTREGWLVLLQVEPMYDSLRNDPRFQDILEKMNFPEID